MLAIYFHSLRKVVVLNKKTLDIVYHALLIFINYRSVPGVFKILLQNLSNPIEYKIGLNFNV